MMQTTQTSTSGGGGGGGRPIQRQRTAGNLGLGLGTGLTHMVFGRVPKEWSDDCVALFKHCAEAFFGTVSLPGFLEILQTHGLCASPFEAHRMAVRQGGRPPYRDLSGWDAVKVLHIVTSKT